jgi:hypothetical protein
MCAVLGLAANKYDLPLVLELVAPACLLHEGAATSAWGAMGCSVPFEIHLIYRLTSQKILHSKFHGLPIGSGMSHEMSLC